VRISPLLLFGLLRHFGLFSRSSGSSGRRGIASRTRQRLRRWAFVIIVDGSWVLLLLLLEMLLLKLLVVGV
jgi:hypothetical protein